MKNQDVIKLKSEAINVEIELLKQVLQAWDISVARWQQHPEHLSIPTTFVPMAVVMDDVQRKL